MKKSVQILLIIVIAIFLLCLIKISFWGIDINSEVDGSLDIDVGNQDSIENFFEKEALKVDID